MKLSEPELPMKFRILVLLNCLIFLSCSSSKETVHVPSSSITDFVSAISAEGLRADLTVIASDSMQGRDTGSEGIELAAKYLAHRYQTLGLQPAGDNGTYFQSFDLSQTIFEEITYSVTTSSGELLSESTHSKSQIGHFSTLYGGKSPLAGAITFVGYGIHNPESQISHFPESANGTWLLTFYERGVTNWNAIQDLVGENGALGALFIMGTDTAAFTEQALRIQNEFGSGSGLELAYLSRTDEEESTINRVHPKMAAQLLGLNSLEELAELEQKIKSSPAGFEPYSIDISVSHTPTQQIEIVPSKNVVAFVEGSDPVLKNEVVVISSHYDHVGFGSPDVTGDSLYNGADDDGSGTVATLNAAQAMISAKRAEVGPKRSILFLHVSGEERGLLGSRYYSDHPIFPIEQTIANLNMDMIGRLDNEHADNPNYIYVIGGKLISSGIQNALETANQMGPNIELSDRYNDLDDPNQFYRRSDHWNFGRLGVPFVFLFNGTHADYHRPSDEVDKIHFEALTKRTKLLFLTTAILANAEYRPEVDNQAFIEKTREYRD
jgi:hypothetical protein